MQQVVALEVQADEAETVVRRMAVQGARAVVLKLVQEGPVEPEGPARLVIMVAREDPAEPESPRALTVRTARPRDAYRFHTHYDLGN